MTEARKYVSDPDAYADNHLLRALADALEAEHQQAEKWAALWEKSANGVLSLQAERDALRTAIQEALAVSSVRWWERDVRAILSRAIDTKEESNG